MAAVEAKALIRADNRRLRGDLGKSQSMFKKSFRKIGGGIKKTLKGALSPLGIAAGVTGLALVGRQVFEFEDGLNRLQIQSGKSGAEIDAFRSTLVGMSRATGISREQLLAGTTALVNLQGAAGFSEKTLGVLAEAQLATGANMEDLAGLTFALGNAFNVVDPKDLTTALSGIIEAGKQGAVPLNQMSASLQKLAITFADFGVKTGPDAAAELAAGLQIVRRGFGTAEEAATGFQSLMAAVLKNSKKLEKAGVDVFQIGAGGVRELRSVRDITADLAKFDQKELIDLLGRIESTKAAAVLGKFGTDLDDLTAKAKKSNAVQEDAEKRRESNAFKIAKAFNNMKEAVAKAFTPERIEAFAEVMAKVGQVLEFMVDNAQAFVGIWLGFKIVGITSAFTKIAGSLAGSVGTSSALVGNMNKLGIAAGVFTAAFSVGTLLDDWLGASDKISDALVNTAARATKIQTGLLISQAEKLGFATRAGETLAVAAGRETSLDRKEQLASSGILRSAREAGVIDPETGKIQRERLLEVAAPESFALGVAEADPRTVALEKAILFAQEVAQREQGGGAAAGGDQKVAVAISVQDDRVNVRRTP